MLLLLINVLSVVDLPLSSRHSLALSALELYTSSRHCCRHGIRLSIPGSFTSPITPCAARLLSDNDSSGHAFWIQANQTVIALYTPCLQCMRRVVRARLRAVYKRVLASCDDHENFEGQRPYRIPRYSERRRAALL